MRLPKTMACPSCGGLKRYNISDPSDAVKGSKKQGGKRHHKEENDVVKGGYKTMPFYL